MMGLKASCILLFLLCLVSVVKLSYFKYASSFHWVHPVVVIPLAGFVAAVVHLGIIISDEVSVDRQTGEVYVVTRNDI